MNKVMAAGTGVVLLLSGGCKTAMYRDEALRVQTINPHFALEYAAKSLECDPGNQKNIDATRSILGALAADHRNRVKEMDSSGDYEGAVMECDRVLASAYFVKSFPGQFNLPYDEGERKEFSEKAADKCYKQGLEYEAQKQPREAFDAYCRCRSFRTNYLDIGQRMKAIEDSAITRLFISPKASAPATTGITGQLATSLPQHTASLRPRFLKFVPDRAVATSTSEVTVSDISVTDSGWVGKDGKNEYKSTTKDQNGQKQEKTYSASWTEYTKDISCTVSAGYTVTPIRQGDPTGAGSSSKTERWVGKYVRWSGDQEAVPSELSKLPNNPPAAPNQGALVSASMNNIIQDLASQLFQNYK